MRNTHEIVTRNGNCVSIHAKADNEQEAIEKLKHHPNSTIEKKPWTYRYDYGECILGVGSLRDMIETHAHKLAKVAGLGSAAGTHINHIHVEVCGDETRVIIECQGLPLVGRTAGPPRVGTAYLYGPIPDHDDIKDLVWDFGFITQQDPDQYYDVCHPMHPDYIGDR